MNNLRLLAVPNVQLPMQQQQQQQQANNTTQTTTQPKVVAIDPAAGPAPAPDLVSSAVFTDQRYFNELLDSLPPEYLSPAIVLHCLIEQVACNLEQSSNSANADAVAAAAAVNKTPVGTDTWSLSQQTYMQLNNLIGNLTLDEKDRMRLGQVMPAPVPQQQQQQQQQTNGGGASSVKNLKTSAYTPILVNHKDDVAHRLKGVTDPPTPKQRAAAAAAAAAQSKLQVAANGSGSGVRQTAVSSSAMASGGAPFDPIAVEYDMLAKSLWSVFTGLPYVAPKFANERAARLQELLKFCSSQGLSNAGNT